MSMIIRFIDDWTIALLFLMWNIIGIGVLWGIYRWHKENKEEEIRNRWQHKKL